MKISAREARMTYEGHPKGYVVHDSDIPSCSLLVPTTVCMDGLGEFFDLPDPLPKKLVLMLSSYRRAQSYEVLSVGMCGQDAMLHVPGGDDHQTPMLDVDVAKWFDGGLREWGRAFLSLDIVEES